MRNALGALNPGGVIACHNMNPTSEDMQALPRARREWTGDCRKAWVTLRGEQPDLAMVVVDADYGVGVILPGKPPPARPSIPCRKAI